MRSLPILLLLLTTSALCVAQSSNQSLTFDAASVKPAGPPVPGSQVIWRGGPGTDSPGRFTMPRATLSQIIQQAFDVWPDQVEGPDWIADRDANAYSVTATMPASTTREQFRAMLRNLLAERFHLRVHHVTRTRSGYELVVAEGGPKIKEWKQAESDAGFKPGADANGFPKMNPTWGPGVLMVVPRSGGAVPVRTTRRETMESFCRGLGADINMSEGRPFDETQARVLDHTGLTGIYDFNLVFTGTVRALGRMPPQPEADSGTPLASDPAQGAPDIFTAVEKQLGLKLRKLKDVPVDVIVVDSADKVPSAN